MSSSWYARATMERDELVLAGSHMGIRNPVLANRLLVETACPPERARIRAWLLELIREIYNAMHTPPQA
ncbi:hypothetical protein LXL04_037407 [Taraxacum kok-saghyz]